MNLKLDENLGKIVADTLRKAGHNVSTVADEGLQGSDDRRVIERSRQENRCLVTLDLEFGNPIIFRPSEYSGIVVLRLRTNPTSRDLQDLILTLVDGLARDTVAGRLWIVQRGRIRVYQEDDAIT